MEKKVVLIVDDEAHIVELLKYNLETAGYAVLEAESGEKALDLLGNQKIDAVLLDQMLPGIDGLEVLRQIRSGEKDSRLPVLMLTAKGEEIDKVIGLELGADDYIAKPFGVRELLARLKAVLRRSGELIAKGSYRRKLYFEDLEIGLDNRKVTANGKDVSLSFKEFEILLFLAQNPGKVFSREELLETIWGYEPLGGSRTVDVHIRHIRQKIEEDDSNPRFIKTVRGYGYKFSEVYQ